jgi:hypothetical protein
MLIFLFRRRPPPSQGAPVQTEGSSDPTRAPLVEPHQPPAPTLTKGQGQEVSESAPVVEIPGLVPDKACAGSRDTGESVLSYLQVRVVLQKHLAKLVVLLR